MNPENTPSNDRSGSEAQIRARLCGLLNYIEQVERLRLKPALVVPVEHYCAWEEELVGLPGLALGPHPTGQAPAAGRRGEAWLHFACPPGQAGSPQDRTREAYDRLFSLHQSIDASGAQTPLELIWGVGIFLWNHPNGQAIAYPLITQQVEVRLDRATLALEVLPRARAPVFESAPFVALRHPAISNVEKAWRTDPALSRGVFSPFNHAGLNGFLQTCVQELGPEARLWRGRDEGSGTPGLPSLEHTPIITDSWVIFARKRSTSTLIDDVDRLRDQIQAGRSIPGGARALVSAHHDAELSAVDADDQPAAPRPVFFPKPFNDEQLSIAGKLATANGVVVQGPPGTGKTHTIANIICDTLANGGRVLVTSKGESALAVLRGHLPESLRPLAVALLTDEHDGTRQFERAIQTIAAAVARINPQVMERRIEALTSQCVALRQRIDAIDSELDRAARPFFLPIVHHGKSLTAADLAHWVRLERDRHHWLDDHLPNGFTAPAIDPAEIDRLRELRRRLGQDLLATGPVTEVPPTTDWPDVSVMAGIHVDLTQARQIEQVMVKEGMPVLPADTLRASQRLRALSNRALKAQDVLKGIEPRPSFQGRLLALARAEGEAALSRVDGLVKETLALDRDRQSYISHPVSLPHEAELDRGFIDAVARACHGRHPLGPLRIGNAQLRRWLQTLKVSGLKPTTQAEWQHIAKWLELCKHIRVLVAQWGALTQSGLEPEQESFDAYLAVAQQVTSVRTLAIEIEPELRASVTELFGESFAADMIGVGVAELLQLRLVIERNQQRMRALQAMQGVARLIDRLGSLPDDAATRMRELLTGILGDPEFSVAVVADRWTSLVTRIRAIAALAPQLAELRKITERIEQAGAPRWANALRKMPVTGADDPLLPEHWLESWQWHQALQYLRLIDNSTQLARLQQERSETVEEYNLVEQRLVEQRVWQRLHQNAPPRVTAALQAYLNAIQQLTLTTGPRAERHRVEARAAMQAAHAAVPCWIMPHWRVSETLPSRLGSFDLVIIDEASQSDLWSLPSLLRGRKMIVVGDDRQVSPEPIELTEERIAALRSEYLNDQPFSDQMSPERSIYDLARVVFSSNAVMLREHFRCVRPIIEFARREFYDNDLVPLRVPRASERIEPSLVDHFLVDGRMTGQVNEVEAAFVVQEVRRILDDPLLTDRTIGVVSLHGSAQARLIFEQLRAQVPARDLIERQFTAGDARAFQGKERDIMLLSMVTDSQWSTRVDSPAEAQAFNVAASRARDQMILVRSVDLPGLEPGDLRARLIEHFAQPRREVPPSVPGALRAACRTVFERMIFDRLTARGYRVVPHVEAGESTINLVVEGRADRRLAIECDGDGAQDLAAWRQSLARQRVLERAGWTVWRVFAASFAINTQAGLTTLQELLDSLGIEPIASGSNPAARQIESDAAPRASDSVH